MDRDLFLAILAMDAYNRSYSQGLGSLDVPEFDLDGNPLSTVELGTAQITYDSSNLGETADGRLDQNAGFYAIAYEWNGETIISYRGTDNPLEDANTGYGLGAGYPDLVVSSWLYDQFFDYLYGDEVGGVVTDLTDAFGLDDSVSQSNLAIDFYSAVTGREVTSIMSADVPTDVVVVGHSLGGGLAGLVASLSGVEGYGYDYMPFASGAFAYAMRFMSALVEANENSEFLDALAAQATSEEYAEIVGLLDQLTTTYSASLEDFERLGLRPPSVDNFTGISVEGELLTYVRNGDIQSVVAAVATVVAVLTGNFAAAAIAVEGWSQAISAPLTDGTVPNQQIELYGALASDQDIVKRHSQALLVILKYAEAMGVGEEWKTAAPELIDALFDDSIAEALGRTQTSDENPGGDGLSAPSDQLKSAIAYSAISEGERPFGDTGIQAWYNDGNRLGSVLAQGDVSDTFRNLADDLARIIAQYAGRLAFADVEDQQYANGILSTNADLSAVSVDLSDQTWDAGKDHQEMTIVGVSSMIRSAIGEQGLLYLYGPTGGGADGIEWSSPSRAGSKWLYGAANPADIVGRLSVQTKDEPFNGMAPSGSEPLPDNEVALFVLGDGDDHVTGSADNDFLIGSGGNDTLDGGLGNDMLFGGDGDDVLTDIFGNNFFYGGDGHDEVDLAIAGALAGFEVTLTAAASPDNDRKTDIEFTLKSGLTGETTTSRMQAVEQLTLTEHGDHLILDAEKMNEYVTGYVDPFGTPFTVDMGSAVSGVVHKSDLDTVEFLARGAGDQTGIFWRNGSTQGALGNLDYSQYSAFGFLSALPVLLENLTGESFAIEDLISPDDTVRTRGLENVILTDEDDSFAFTSEDYSIHSGVGTISGGAGEDVVLYFGAKDYVAGEYFDPSQQALAEAKAAAEAAGEVYDGPEPDANAPKAGEELRLVINGGDDDDRLMVRGGDGAIVIGGDGRDFLYNSSYKGQLWGDGLDGRGASYTGAGNDDTFWWSAGSFIMDAGKNDRLQAFGLPLVGGTNFGPWGASLETGVARDFLLPWVTYGLTESNQLLVDASIADNLDPGQSEEKILEIAQVVQNWESGDLGIEFTVFGGEDNISLFHALWQLVGDFASYVGRFAKNISWSPVDDPLVLDLNGDGLVSRGIGAVYWDNDGDLFGEKSGWLSGEDGFLVHDADNSGTITADELFGGPGLSGFDELAEWDSNGDGIVNAEDVEFANLQIWRDANENGITDAGELHALAAFGVTAFSVRPTAVDLETANGTIIRAESFYAREDGSTGAFGELIFETDRGATKYLGDNRIADFAPSGISGDPIDAFGYGITTDLAVAASNDLALAQLLQETAAQMTVGDLDVLRDQAVQILGRWARSQTASRELSAVLVGDDGAMLDHAVYVEDASGGYWLLASGADVLAADGSVIARATLEQVAEQLTENGSWRLVQGWSPSERTDAIEDRVETAYLIGENAAVLDYAIRHVDAQGEFWTLSSGTDVLAEDGSVIARASLADIMAQEVTTGEWRMEDFAEPDAAPPYDEVAFYMRDGIVTDYSVWIKDSEGYFAVWSSNLSRALESQAAYGPGSFGLRGFALDLDNLPDADNSDDSAVRVEILSLDEIDYAFASAGHEFRDELFVADAAADNTLAYQYDIKENIAFAGTLVDSYLAVGRAMAVRIATQGGLAHYFEGVEYDPATDTFQATSGRELIPLFTAILADAPSGAEETVDYLRDWDRVLQTVYPDFKRHGRGPKSQAFLMQMIVAGFENSPVDASFMQVAEALSIDEERVLEANAANPNVDGTNGDDLIYVSSGASIARGGLGSDVYIVGRDFGEVTIQDVEPILQPSASDYLRFAHLTPDDVYVTKDGADLVIQEIGTDNILTIRNQFEGRWPGIFGGDFSDNTEITEITFADGTAWDFVDMAYAASHPLDSNDVVYGTEAIDVLDGGAGNDILRGGGDSDLYIFGYGYGADRVVDGENNPFRKGIDIVVFGEGITAEMLSFERIGDSNDVTMYLLDEAGERTGDSLTVEGQFFQQDAFITTLRPNMIERFVFQDGTFLDEKQVRERVLAEARTDGEDAIWAFDDAETMDGGAGDDLLVGKNGADTYVFARGYGDDVMWDQSFEVGIGVVETPNTLRMEGINAADVEILREPDSQTIGLRITDTGETIWLKNQFEATFAGLWIVWRDNVDRIEFADGTSWDMDRLDREVLSLERTDGDDHIIGFDWSDTLDGGAGDDFLEGGLYNDTYVFAEGYGHDRVYDAATDRHLLMPRGFDTLDLRGIDLEDVEFTRAASDLTIVLRSTGESVTLVGQYNRLGDSVVENISFAGLRVDWQDLGADDIDLIGTDGDDVLIGTHYAETIDGRGGNDILRGSSDGDTYLFDIGYGADVIDDTIDSGQWRAEDTVRFGADVVFADTRFTREGNDLLISFVGHTDTLRISDQFGSVLAGVENFVFADGNQLHISDVEELLQIAGGTRGDNTLTGFDDRENILDGRQGDDQLYGGSFGDTYLFGVGYDFDTITEKTDAQSNADALDRVVFGRLVDPADVMFRLDGTDLVITLPDSGEQLTIVDGMGARKVEQFDFYDGTIWGEVDIRAALLRSTDGDDHIVGFDDSDDIIAGGTGRDLMQGRAGDDIYRFGIGDGLDAIEDSAGVDRIELGEGISADMVSFTQVDDGLLLTFTGFDDSLFIRGGLDVATRIESVVFADGFTLGFEDIRNALIEGQATDSDDIVVGFADRADVLNGSAGNDELKGLTGDDIYVIGEDPGLDIVSDTGGEDRVRFTAGQSDQMLVRRLDPDSGDIAISFVGMSGETIIRGAIDGDGRIEEYEFADGLVLTTDEMRLRVIEAAQSDGNDYIQGFADAAAPSVEFVGGRGDDIIIGQANGDSFVFRRGDGSDTIIDTGSGTDVLKIEGYAASDLSFERLYEASGDVLITFAGSDDRIILRGQADGDGIEQISFGDGKQITRSAIDAILPLPVAGGYKGGNVPFTGNGASQTLLGGPGDDTLNNGSSIDSHVGNDTLIGGEGNDWMRGGGGNDVYLFSAGFGRDTISEGLNWRRMGTDRIEFDETISPDDVELSRSANGNDLIVRIKGTDDQIYVSYGIGNGGRDTDTGRIEEIRFADGTSWGFAQMVAWTEPGTAGDDTIYGIYAYNVALNGFDGNDSIQFGRDLEYDATADVITGGGGNDWMRGGRGNDVYMFSAGFGQDRINEGSNWRGMGSDRIEFDATISAADVTISRDLSDNNTIILQVLGTGDRIRIEGGIGIGRDQDDYRIEQVKFADGTVWTYAQILAQANAGTAGDDTIYGAFAYGNLLQGGAGNDRLYYGTNLEYTANNDILVGGEGNDWMSGGRGNDTYRFSAGFGRDTISEGSIWRGMGSDTLEFDETITRDQLEFYINGNHLVVRVSGTEDEITLVNGAYNTDYRIETARFADGTTMGYAEMIAAAVAYSRPDDDTLVGDAADNVLDGGAGRDTLRGDAGNDTLDGGVGDDTLEGGLGDDTYDGGEDQDSFTDAGGNDTYRFELGDGRDVIDDASGTDRIEFGVGIGPDDVLLKAEQSRIVLRIGDAGDVIYVMNGDVEGTGLIETIAFADGTEWDAAEILSRYNQARDDAGYYRGTQAAETLDGGRGDDTIVAVGDGDTLIGGEGNDTLAGTSGSEILDGGLGDDSLSGGGGDDVYRWSPGDGQDVLTDTGGVDTVELGEGVTADMIRVIRSGNNIVLMSSDTNSRLTITNGLTDATGVIETVRFADGTQWDAAEILRRSLLGSDNADTIAGDGGDDTIVAGGGDDTVSAGAGNDVIDGGAGNDSLTGGAGDDTYIWRRGDGEDRIVEAGGVDVIELEAGIASAELLVTRSGTSDIALQIAGTTDRIVIAGALASEASQIETIRFADGTVWTHAELAAFATTGTPRDDVYRGMDTAEVMAGAGGNDRIFGNGGDDTIDGGAGNDRLEGGDGADELTGSAGNDLLLGVAGDDRYVYTLGDGRDVIVEKSGTDTIRIIGAGADDMAVRRFEEGNNDLLLDFGDGSSILIVDAMTTAGQIETVEFADTGEFVTAAELVNRAIADRATDGDDYITGSSAGDRLAGGSGDDILAGGAGDDIYIFASGDGRDRFVDNVGSADTLVFTDYRFADVVSLFRSPPAGHDLVISFANGDTAILADALLDGDAGIDSIEFVDGTVISPNDLRADLLASFDAPGDSSIWGFTGDDLLAGGAGSDELHGLEGDDTYVYRAGDGFDTIEDNGGGTDRLVIEGYASTDARIARLYFGSSGASLSFVGSPDDALTLVNFTAEGEDRIESIEFSDGVVWDFATLEGLMGNNAPVANRDAYRDMVQGETLYINAATLLANDFDADGDPLSIHAITEVTGGSATLLDDGSIQFVADPDFSGFATVSYFVGDGRQGFGEAELSIRVRPLAVANDDSGITVDEDDTVIMRTRALLANDVDGDRMEIAEVKNATHGIVSLSSTGDITFTPDADFNGTASFVYVANTPEGGRDEALVEIEVLPVNDAPIARDDAPGLYTDEGVPLLINANQVQAWLANDGDIDGDALSVVSVDGNGDVAATLNEDGSVTIDPIGDFFGNTSFNYTITDGSITATAKVFLTVGPVNDPPVAMPDTITTDEDTPLYFSAELLTANDYDPDGVPVTIAAVTAVLGGSVILFENNTILFDPATNFNGTAGFTYTLNDGEGGITTQQVEVIVTPVNDAPTARTDYALGLHATPGLVAMQGEELVIDPATILANDYDIDSPSFSLQTVSFADHGTVSLGEDGMIHFTPDEGFWGKGSFNYVIADDDMAVGDGHVEVYFRPTGNVAPVAEDDYASGVEDEALIITREQLLANDYDPNGDAIEITGNVSSLGLSASMLQDWYWNEDGDLVVVPYPDVPSGGTLYYTVTDGTFNTTGTLHVSFAPVNDAPTAQEDEGFESGLGRPVVIRVSDLKANDYDIDVSSFQPVDSWAYAYGAAGATITGLDSDIGSASLYGDEFIVIEFDSAYSGAINLGYTLTDAAGLSDGASVAITVSDLRDTVITGTEIRDLLIGSGQGETIVGLDGEDDLYGRGGDDILRGGDGADLLDGGDGFDIADFSDSEVAMRVDINSRIGQGGFAEGDELVSIEGLIGGTGSDQLYGEDGHNLLRGGDGNDFIDGRGGDDTISGEAGDDTLIGGAGADDLLGGEGVDTADYSDSADPVIVSLADGTGIGGDADGDTLDSIENVIGTLGDDVLTGDDADNMLIGGRGDDQLAGGAGDDMMEGGRGADAIVGGEGNDTARYWLSDQAVQIDLAAGTAAGGDAAGDALSGIENLIGSAHDDMLTGDAGDNIIDGGGGGDTIDGGAGIDTVDYSDSVDGVAVDLGAGSGSAGDADGDILTGIENVTGSNYADTITGDAGDNQLSGGRGDDTLAGGAGSDRYLLGNGTHSDSIIEAGTAGNDTLEIAEGYGPDAVSIYAEGNDLIVQLEQDDAYLSDSVRIKDHFLGDGAGIEAIVFGDGTNWDRATIDANAASGLLQAEDDIVRWADEDMPFVFDAATLLVNDTVPADSTVSVLDVSAISGGTVSLGEDGAITFLSDPDFNGDAFFRYRMVDENGRISSATAEVTVRPVNDSPYAMNDSGYVMDEDGAYSIPVSWLLANDGDIDGDALSITGFERVDGGHGSASVEFAGYVTFRPDADYSGEASFRYRVSDTDGLDAWATVSLDVRAVNDAPRAVSDGATVRSGTSVLVDVDTLLANDYDPEGDAFSFGEITGATNGTAMLVVVDGQTMVRFSPAAGYFGPASFTYSIVETGTGLSDEGSVSVTVLPPNDPPVARGETLQGLEDTPLVIEQATLLANDTDPNSDVLTVVRLDDFPEHGSVAFDEDGNIVFTPAADYNGPASFRYWISDGEFEREATASVEVAPQNDAPVVADDEGPFVGDEDKVLVLRAADLFGNDSDAEGDVLEFAEFTASVGTIVLDGQNLLLTPPANYNGPITVTYRARDEKGAISENTAIVSVIISDIPDKPVAVDDFLEVNEDTELVIDASQLIGNDTDADGSTLRLASVGNAQNGNVVLEDGVVIFLADPDFHGTASFEYEVTDDEAGSVTGIAYVEVAPVNDAPRITSDVLSTDEDVALRLAPAALLANDIDPDGETITITAVSALTEGASAAIEADGTIVLTPPQNGTGIVRFEYTVSDPLGTESTGLVSVFVAEVNDAPIATGEGPITIDEDAITFFAIADLLANDTDVDGDLLDLSVVSAEGGNVAIVGDMLRFTPDADYNGSASITYRIADGHGASDEAQIVLDIAPINDAPILTGTLGDLSSQEDTAMSFTIDTGAFADIDGDALSFTALLDDGSDLPDWLSFDGATLSGTPPQDFNGSLNIRIVASDGEFEAQAGFVLTIDPVNDAPVLLAQLLDVTTSEDTAIAFALPQNAFGDVDGDQLTLTASLADGAELPSWLSFNGVHFTGQPPRDFNGTLQLRVTASDGEFAVSDDFALVITPVNDAPVVAGAFAPLAATEDTAFSIAIDPGHFTDIDGDALTLSFAMASGLALPEWLVFDGEMLTGTPPQDFNGTLDLAISASDGQFSASTPVQLVIDAVNDAPVVLMGLDDLNGTEDSAFELGIPSDVFADVDGDVLTIIATMSDGSALPDWLSFDGARFTGTPPQDFNGEIALTLYAGDGELSVSEQFSLIIDPVNDAPVLVQNYADLASDEDAAISFALPLGNFTDVDDDALVLTASLLGGGDLPSWLSFDGETLSGTPPQDFNGELDLQLTASDGEYHDTASFRLTIDPVNDAPVILRPLAEVVVSEDSPVSFALPEGWAGDIDGDALSISLTLADGSPVPSWLVLNGSVVEGMPPQDFNGSIQLLLTASDGEYTASDALALTVLAVNDAPVVASPLADVEVLDNELSAIAIPAGTFADVDGDMLGYTATLGDGSSLPEWMSFDGAGFTVDPDRAFSGVLDVTVTATDGEYAVEDGFKLTVIKTNRAPVAGDDALFVGLQAQDLVILSSDLLSNDTDEDGDPLEIVSFTSGAHGAVSRNAVSDFVYSVDSSFVGEDSFTYTISDGLEQSTATVTLRIDSPFEGWSEGTDGDDKLFGNNKESNQILGVEGEDQIKGGKETDWLAGGDGDDHLIGLSGDDHMWGNAGNDLLNGNEGFDTAYFFGLRDSYVVQTVSGTVSVTDTDAANDGDDGTDTISSIELLSFKNGQTASVISPIILDLGGDGFELLSAEESDARFDLDGDGLADDTSWVGAGDAFLYLDRNGDGTLSDASEISFIDDFPNASSDLGGLRAFDSDGDGTLSTLDVRFSEFSVWLDVDGDGAVDDGETASLADIGIVALNLTGTPVEGTSALGEVAVLNTGSYILADGTTREFLDAALTYFSAATNSPEFAPDELDFDKKSRITWAGGQMYIARKGRGIDDDATVAIGPNVTVEYRGKDYGFLQPIVLDLDGDGVSLKKRKKSDARFDMDGNGVRDDTGWIDDGDGFLVIDRDNDGKITDASELSLAAENPDAVNALHGLAALDSNGDGIVDASDARFNELKVWVDADSDGITDSGELRTLADMGIVSLSLSGTAEQGRSKLDRNAVVAVTSFSWANGDEGDLANVSLGYRPSEAAASRSSSWAPGIMERQDLLAGKLAARGGILEDIQAAIWRFENYAKDLNANQIEQAANELMQSAPMQTTSDLPETRRAALDPDNLDLAALPMWKRMALIRQKMATFDAGPVGILPIRSNLHAIQPDWFA